MSALRDYETLLLEKSQPQKAFFDNFSLAVLFKSNLMQFTCIVIAMY